ncbi:MULTISPECIES: HpcH/HpaI aldolase/citrate lyase family protein [Cupriavidus]|uniref:HpcH/HpaI aldolase/citrate lyase family protein n=1 Tax=Cupriavidus sp. WS TaxID=1312922 RepID=UPI00037AFAD2|nr:aldolase/citrate lyase family protein [Cupriavidus sp. WS]
MTQDATPLPWLSLLYVPAHDARRLEDALRSGAHAAILDLEDFVPYPHKAQARQALPRAAAACRAAGMGVAVRINRRMDLAAADIEHAVAAGADAIMMTKAMGAQHLMLVDELVGAWERRRGLAAGGIRLIALVETAAAIGRMEEICRASRRLVAIGLGGEDVARECAMVSSEDTLRLPKQQMIFAAVAAGIVPLGYLASVVDYRNADEFAAMVRRSRAFGFQAATCVNAEQVAVVNAAYAPTARELDAARAALAVRDAGALREDDGALPHETESARRRAALLLARGRMAACMPS